MNKLLLSILLLGLVSLSLGCGTMKNTETKGNGSVSISEISTDATYGSEKNPIMVGGVVDSKGPANEQAFLNLLAGPNGETISYSRIRSCCAFDSPCGFGGKGLLDVYQITYKGQDKPIELYINMYDYQKLYAPVGFTIR